MNNHEQHFFDLFVFKTRLGRLHLGIVPGAPASNAEPGYFRNHGPEKGKKGGAAQGDDPSGGWPFSPATLV